jgi:transcriptional regulator with XRE-family HTH domain
MLSPRTNNLRALRRQRGLTLKQVAQHLGLRSDARISLWERGLQYPHALNLTRLLILYGVRAEEVYVLTEGEPAVESGTRDSTLRTDTTSALTTENEILKPM